MMHHEVPWFSLQRLTSSQGRPTLALLMSDAMVHTLHCKLHGQACTARTVPPYHVHSHERETISRHLHDAHRPLQLSTLFEARPVSRIQPAAPDNTQ